MAEQSGTDPIREPDHRALMRERRAPFYGLLLLPLLPVFVVVKFIVWIARNA
jgi:hypothetical protein